MFPQHLLSGMHRYFTYSVVFIFISKLNEVYKCFKKFLNVKRKFARYLTQITTHKSHVFLCVLHNK